MEIKYFPDTDTLLITFSNEGVVETRDINENVLIDLNQNGDLVSMTIEHAKQHMDVESVSYQKVVT